MRKKVFFIPTERYSDFNSMIERYEQEMRRIFAEKQRISGFEEPAAETAVFPEDAPAVPEFQQREQDNIKVPEPEREEKAQPLPEIVPDGIGHIIVEVTTARGAVPLSGVDVVIDRLDTDDAKGRQELITLKQRIRAEEQNPLRLKH